MVAAEGVTVSSRVEPFAAHLDPRALARDLVRHRHLIWSLAVRDVQLRFRGSGLGVLWMVLRPLLLLAIYTFVFAVVFRARWTDAGQASRSEYSMALFCGLVVFGLFAECAGGAPSLIPSRADYVKRAVFPLQILPVVSVCTVLLISCFSLGILLAGVLVLRGHVTPWVALLPVMLVPAVLMALAAGWLLAAVGAFVRDLDQIVALGLSILMFTTPIFFPLSAVPGPFRVVLEVNPLTAIVESARALVLWGQPPHWPSLLLVMVGSALGAQLCYAVFMRLRPGFADMP